MVTPIGQALFISMFSNDYMTGGGGGGTPTHAFPILKRR